MKKTILALILSTAMLFTFGQQSRPTILKSYKNTVGYWNSEKQEYVFGDYNYANINFTLQENYITCDDVQRSIYRIIKRLPDSKTKTSKVMSVKCTDESNKDCVFGVMIPFDGSNSSIGIIYDYVMYVYVLDK